MVTAHTTGGMNISFMSSGGGLWLHAVNGEHIDSITLQSAQFTSATSINFFTGPGGIFEEPEHVIPEPGTLGLLGTGMIGLAGVVRRNLKFGK